MLEIIEDAISPLPAPSDIDRENFFCSLVYGVEQQSPDKYAREIV
jgi:hypothetical protein